MTLCLPKYVKCSTSRGHMRTEEGKSSKVWEPSWDQSLAENRGSDSDLWPNLASDLIKVGTKLEPKLEAKLGPSWLS